ncbi:YgaP family membrane protein [Nonlabens ulvanivorans]|uniref:YgaP family membrane protein n=1 Tax=Nonlabens ulvanivorans TaxID=906888 RepID=UPI0032667BA6
MLNTYFRVIVGTMVLLSVVLTVYVSPNWMWFTVFIGVNLIQSAFTKWCLLETILVKLGVKKEAKGCAVNP